MSAKGLTPVVLSGLGSAGLNTQSQDATLGPEWLTEADNVVFDFQGRIAARKGIKQVSKIVASSIKTIGGYIKPDRTREYFGGSGATVVKMDTTVIPHSLTTQSFSGTPQTITDSDWQWVNFNDEFWGVQDGHTPINYDGTNWYDIDDLGAYAAPTGPTTFDPSCALGDFGRMWYGGITEDPGTIYYSDNLIGEKLTGGAAGILNLRTVWGSDEIAVRNDLARILSTSTVSNIKSAYYMEDGIIVTFMPDDQKAYVFDFATSQKIPRITVWAFTSTAASPLCGLGTIDGKMYMGMTDSIAEYAGYYDVTISESTGTYGNQTVCEAAGDTWETSTCWSYTNSDYSYTFQSSWLDLGNPVVSKIVKTGLFTFVGGRGATAEVFVFKDYELGSQFSHSFTLTNSGTVYLYGQPDALFGTAIYASTTGPQEYRIPLGRTGKVIRLKLVTTVSGNSSSLVNTTLLTKQGKIR